VLVAAVLEVLVLMLLVEVQALEVAEHRLLSLEYL